jgi:hypothetical protein
MSHERWGAFSVVDHKDLGGVAPDVLLYDRLVFPVPGTDFEKARWEAEGWQPRKQEEMLEALDDLAVSASWNGQDQRKWAELNRALQEDVAQIVSEARQDLGYLATRMVLAAKRYPLPHGVDGVDVIAANRSEQEFRRKFEVDLEEVSSIVPNFGIRLSQRIAVPLSDRDPKDALTSSVQLARDGDFRRKRSRVYELQNQVLSTAEPALETFQELEAATEDLINYICLMVKRVRFTNAFGLVGIQPGHAVGRPFRGYKSRSTTISALQFRGQVHGLTRPAGSSAPTAMYHE